VYARTIFLESFAGRENESPRYYEFYGGNSTRADLWATIIRVQDKRPSASTHKCKCGIFALARHRGWDRWDGGGGGERKSLALFFLIFKKTVAISLGKKTVRVIRQRVRPHRLSIPTWRCMAISYRHIGFSGINLNSTDLRKSRRPPTRPDQPFYNAISVVFDFGSLGVWRFRYSRAIEEKTAERMETEIACPATRWSAIWSLVSKLNKTYQPGMQQFFVDVKIR